MMVLALTVTPATSFAQYNSESPVITHTAIDYSTMIIYVYGSDFGTRKPIVKLGDIQLVGLSWHPQWVTAQLPSDIVPGSYNLTLFCTFRHHHKMLEASLSVAVGAEGYQEGLGPQGPMGLTGPAGPQGPEGPQGPIGLTGPAGPQGPAGPAGPQGTAGLQGPIGLTGPAGPQGLTGATGSVGPIGPQGPQGPIGLTGPAGAQGPAGPQGPQGPEGPQGPAGPAGTGGSFDPTKLHIVRCGGQSSCSCSPGETLISGGAQCPLEGSAPFLLSSYPAPATKPTTWIASCGGPNNSLGTYPSSIFIICLSP